jgi:hypothetical protein
MLQYKLDHCRRLLEGSGSHISDGIAKSRFVKVWIYCGTFGTY